MSAYAHEMERQFSAQNVSSGGSEMESHYLVESGFYLTSFAAAIFIASIITVGILLISLVIALSLMLESCQSRSKGVVEIQKLSDDDNYCNIFALHAEINNLGPVDLPSICRSAMKQIKESRYERDLNVSLWVVERYFHGVTPLDDGLDVVLIDIDDILGSNPHCSNISIAQSYQYGCSDSFEEPKHLKKMLFLRLFTNLQASGWSLILLSRKPEKQRNDTIKHLIAGGYRGWSSVVMRSDDEMDIDSHEYFAKRRVAMQKEGYRILGIISSQMDALTGPSLGHRIFKLPSTSYYCSEHHREIKYVPE